MHRKALDLDPIHGQTRLLLGRALVQRQSFAGAIEQLSKDLELSPESPERIAALAHAYAASGPRDHAIGLLNRLPTMAGQRYVSSYSIAMVYAGLGAKNETLAYLNRAQQEVLAASSN